MTGEDRLERARSLHEEAVFGGVDTAIDEAEAVLDAVEADLALARGRIVHARFLETRRGEDPREGTLFERAAELYAALGDARGEAEALFWIGVYHQVVHGDAQASRAPLERSYELAVAAGDRLTLSYAARHLGFAAGMTGDVETARERLEESLQLRRDLGFTAGVAAAVLALADLARRTGQPDEARARLDEAEHIARGCGANGTLRSIEQMRAEVVSGDP